MARHGQSGRIVIDVEPGLKRQFYSALSLSGITLKDWFIKAAAEYCEEKQQPSFLKQVRYGRNGRAKAVVVREEYEQVAARALAADTNEKVEKKHSVVSMFSGCGGMDLGFTGGFEVFGRRYRSLPFEIVWANDISGAACKTYRRNLRHEIHRGDVWELIGTLPEAADVLVGGFPCQDISVNDKWVGGN
jgi:hypothetical protein